MLNDTLDARLQELIRQWNIAERRVKQAENARSQEIVASAIFELRYAGRKVIDAIQLVLNNDWKSEEYIAEQIHAFIDDAIEDCIKAKHDAIDAVISFVVRWFSDHEKKIGLGYIQRYFPTYLEITAKISDIQIKIEKTRQNRLEKRDSLYDEIEIDGYDQILDLYKQMKTSQKRVNRVIIRERLRQWFLWVVGIGGMFLGGVDLYLHYIHW